MRPKKNVDPLTGCEPVGMTRCKRVLYRRGGEFFTYWAWGDELVPATAKQIAEACQLVDRHPSFDGQERTNQ